MIIKRIKLNNIRSYNEQEITFPEGRTLLAGDIGSGKTSILLGIEFAFFGLQPGQRGNSILKNNKTEGGVEIEFEIDNKNIVIARTLKKGKTISQDSCSISINGGKSEISVSELKSKVLDILNYPSEFAKKQNLLYKFTVYTPQEEMKKIIQQDSETRLNTLRHVFGVDKYKKILENTSILLSKIREEKRLLEGATLNLEQDKMNLFTKEKELNDMVANLSLLEEELKIRKEKRERLQLEKIELQGKIEEKNKLKQEIEKTKLIISGKEDSIIENKKAIFQLELQIKELSKMKFDDEEILEIEKNIEAKKIEREKLNNEIIDTNSQINSLNYIINENLNLEKKISNLENCPTCLQKVDAIYRANVLNKTHNAIIENKNKIQELEQSKLELNTTARKINLEIDDFQKKLEEFKIVKVKLDSIFEKQKRIDELKNLINTLDKDITFLRQHFDSLNMSLAGFEKLDLQFQEKEREYEEALRLERISEIKLAEIKKEKEVFSKQINDLNEKIKETEKSKEKLNYFIELENWLAKKFSPLISNIERNVMIKLRSNFSKFFSEWFAMLVSDSFNIRLSADFTPIIEQQDYELDYAYLSGGERTAIALAYRLALNQVINSVLSKIKTKDLVILDEPTDGFSSQQLDKMREVLDQLNIKQLIIVSHEQKIEGFVDNVIKLKKEAGVSKID